MVIKPIGDKIVVKVSDGEEKTKGGIIIPTSAVEKPQIGIILAVGDGKILENGQHIQPNVKVGDKILFAKYSGVEVKLDDKEYVVLKENDILAILSE
jgi:chaperonin GroES